MPKKKTALTIEELLIKYKISAEEYNLRAAQLEVRGYNPDDIKKIIFRRSSRPALVYLIENHDALVGLGLTPQQLARIAAHSGGSKNLKAIQASHQALQALGFSSEQVVSMVSHNGGSQNLKAIQDSYQALKAYGCTAEQMVSMVAQGGANAIRNFLRKGQFMAGPDGHHAMSPHILFSAPASMSASSGASDIGDPSAKRPRLNE